MTRKKCYNEDHAKASMTKWATQPEIHQGKLVRHRAPAAGPRMQEYRKTRSYLQRSIPLQTELCCVLTDCLRLRLSHIGLI